MSLTIVAAGDLKIGDQLPEEDGFLFDVTAVDKSEEGTVKVTLVSEFSSMPAHQRGVQIEYETNEAVYKLRKSKQA